MPGRPTPASRHHCHSSRADATMRAEADKASPAVLDVLWQSFCGNASGAMRGSGARLAGFVPRAAAAVPRVDRERERGVVIRHRQTRRTHTSFSEDLFSTPVRAAAACSPAPSSGSAPRTSNRLAPARPSRTFLCAHTPSFVSPSALRVDFHRRLPSAAATVLWALSPRVPLGGKPGRREELDACATPCPLLWRQCRSVRSEGAGECDVSCGSLRASKCTTLRTASWVRARPRTCSRRCPASPPRSWEDDDVPRVSLHPERSAAIHSSDVLRCSLEVAEGDPDLPRFRPPRTHIFQTLRPAALPFDVSRRQHSTPLPHHPAGQNVPHYRRKSDADTRSDSEQVRMRTPSNPASPSSSMTNLDFSLGSPPPGLRSRPPSRQQSHHTEVADDVAHTLCQGLSSLPMPRSSDSDSDSDDDGANMVMDRSTASSTVGMMPHERVETEPEQELKVSTSTTLDNSKVAGPSSTPMDAPLAYKQVLSSEEQEEHDCM
ncbi:hypothetical protein B0H10DRAFT_2221942 [Mycena sp. CBHHK59/15]|nr:hypothetical protein B0H10DRAFT_2221942 [Mycena sp. CBHHK59/15]